MIGCRLQIADKLCSAFGQDILDTLFAAETLGAKASHTSIRLKGQRESRQERAERRRQRTRPFFFFLLALAYVREYDFSEQQQYSHADLRLSRCTRLGILLPTRLAQRSRQLI
jgi:hypothetical protein